MFLSVRGKITLETLSWVTTKITKMSKKTIVKTIFDPCEKSFKNLWQAKNKRYRVIFKVYYVITCTSFFANLKRISITARAYNFCYLLDLSIISWKYLLIGHHQYQKTLHLVIHCNVITNENSYSQYCQNEWL